MSSVRCRRQHKHIDSQGVWRQFCCVTSSRNQLQAQPYPPASLTTPPPPCPSQVLTRLPGHEFATLLTLPTSTLHQRLLALEAVLGGGPPAHTATLVSKCPLLLVQPLAETQVGAWGCMGSAWECMGAHGGEGQGQVVTNARICVGVNSQAGSRAGAVHDGTASTNLGQAQ